MTMTVIITPTTITTMVTGRDRAFILASGSIMNGTMTIGEEAITIIMAAIIIMVAVIGMEEVVAIMAAAEAIMVVVAAAAAAMVGVAMVEDTVNFSES